MKEIVQAHLQQNYGELKDPPDLKRLIEKYRLFPNESLYVIDCANANLTPLTNNFAKMVGVQMKDEHELDCLFDHISTDNYEAVTQWVQIILGTAFVGSNGVIPEEDVFNCMYLSDDGRVMLKCTSALLNDSNGAVRYSVGKLTDLTGLVPFQHFSYSFLGPNKEKLLENYRLRAHGKSTLTERESEIIGLIGIGLTSEKIGEKLFISKHTVDKHRRNIIEKLETTSALSAYNKCKNSGFL